MLAKLFSKNPEKCRKSLQSKLGSISRVDKKIKEHVQSDFDEETFHTLWHELVQETFEVKVYAIIELLGRSSINQKVLDFCIKQQLLSEYLSNPQLQTKIETFFGDMIDIDLLKSLTKLPESEQIKFIKASNGKQHLMTISLYLYCTLVNRINTFRPASIFQNFFLI